MPATEVEFVYHTGVSKPLFCQVRLCGCWDATGMPSEDYAGSAVAMSEAADGTGCPAFHVTVGFPESAIGRQLRWGVQLDSPLGRDVCGIPTEIRDAAATGRYRIFTLSPGHTTQRASLGTTPTQPADISTIFRRDGRPGSGKSRSGSG